MKEKIISPEDTDDCYGTWGVRTSEENEGKMKGKADSTSLRDHADWINSANGTLWRTPLFT